MKRYSKYEDLKKAMLDAMDAYSDSLNEGDSLDQDGKAGEDWWQLHLEEQQVSVGLMEWQFTIDIEILGARWHRDDNGEGLWWDELDDIGFDITVSDIHCYTQDGSEVKASKLAAELEKTLQVRQEMVTRMSIAKRNNGLAIAAGL